MACFQTTTATYNGVNTATSLDLPSIRYVTQVTFFNHFNIITICINFIDIFTFYYHHLCHIKFIELITGWDLFFYRAFLERYLVTSPVVQVRYHIKNKYWCLVLEQKQKQFLLKGAFEKQHSCYLCQFKEKFEWEIHHEMRKMDKPTMVPLMNGNEPLDT